MDLSDLVQKAAGEAGDFALYTSIRNYIYARIEYFMEFAPSRNLSLTLTIVVSLLTLWIMIQGFLIATGVAKTISKPLSLILAKALYYPPRPWCVLHQCFLAAYPNRNAYQWRCQHYV